MSRLQPPKDNPLLVRRARDGDGEAQGELIKRWTPIGIKFLMKKGCSKEQAEDEVNNLWRNMVEKKFPIKNEYGFPPFFFKALRNRWIDHLRRSSPDSKPVSSVGNPVSSRAIEWILWNETKDFLSEFEEGRVLLLSVLADKPREVMDAFGIDRNRYYYCLRVARERLKELLKSEKETRKKKPKKEEPQEKSISKKETKEEGVKK